MVIFMNKIYMKEINVSNLRTIADITEIENASFVQLTMKNPENSYLIKTPDILEISGKFQYMINEPNIDLRQIEIGNFSGIIEIHY